MATYFASGTGGFHRSGTVITGNGMFTAATIGRVTVAGATAAGVRGIQGMSIAVPSLALRSGATAPLRGSMEGSAADVAVACVGSLAGAYDLMQSIILLKALTRNQGMLTVSASRTILGQPAASMSVRFNLDFYTSDALVRSIMHNLLQCGMDSWGYLLALAKIINEFSTTSTDPYPLLLVVLNS